MDTTCTHGDWRIGINARVRVTSKKCNCGFVLRVFGDAARRMRKLERDFGKAPKE